MKLKSFLFVMCFGLISTAFAENASYSHATNPDRLAASSNQTMGCEVRVFNDTARYPYFDGYDVYVSTNVDNYYRTWVVSPNHFLPISLIYDGYCHAGFGNIRITSYYSPTYNTGWVDLGSDVHVNYLQNKLQASITAK